MKCKKQYIVEECNVTAYKYYNILQRAKLGIDFTVNPRGSPYNEDGLCRDGLYRIEYLVNDPTKSYTVSDICVDMKQQYEHKVSRKMVYYQLTKKPDYIYKRNYYRLPTLFKPEQVIARYKLSTKLIELFKEGKTIVALDETGFHVGIKSEYSYAKKGKHPFRTGLRQPGTCSVMMAITKERVFAYNVRSYAHTIHVSVRKWH